MAILTKI